MAFESVVDSLAMMLTSNQPMFTPLSPLSSSSISPPPLLPSQPPLSHQPPVLPPSPAPTGPPLSLVLLNGHTGRSLAFVAPATDSVASIISHVVDSNLIPSTKAETLLLLHEGSDISSPAAASLPPPSQLLQGRAADGQTTTIYVYSRELLAQTASSPNSAPSTPTTASLSLPLTPAALTFTLPAAPLTHSATVYSRLSASSSVVLRSLPDYIRIFTQQLAVITSAIEHIDHIVQCTRVSLQQLAAINAALLPIRTYTHNALMQHMETTTQLWHQWQQLSETQQAALDTFEPAISSLAHIALPVSLSGGRNGSTLLECVDERALRDSMDKARRDKDKSEWKRNEARRQEDDIKAALEEVRPYLPQEEEAQVRAVMDGWSSGEKRRECVGWMNRLMEVRDEAQRYCQQVESRLQSVSAAELEREVRVKQMEMEGWNRRNKEEKEAGMYNYIAVYKHAAAQLLSFSTSLFAHHTASLAHCFSALSTLSSLSASLPLYRRLLAHSMDSFAPLIRLNRLSQSYTESVCEVYRRQQRRQRRQKEVTAVVERWRREESEERERRVKWWQEWGVNLPVGMQMGLKEESGWVKVEVCDWDGLLPVVTDEEVRRVRRGTAKDEDEVEETKEEKRAEENNNESETELREQLKRLQLENAALKAELRQQQKQQPTITTTSPTTTTPPVPSKAGPSEELYTLRQEVDRRQALLNDANKTNAWLEEELNKREEELTVERVRREKSDRDSREVAMKLVAHVKERTRERARLDECERERLVWQERCNERVTLLQPAVNDMVMAVRVSAGGDAEKERSGGVPVYRVRLAGDSTRPMFLSAETMSVMREKRSSGVWPEWLVGHVVELVGKRASSTVREVEAGMKIGEEYWMATVALVDFTERQQTEKAGGGEGSTSSSSSQPSSSSFVSSSSSPSNIALDALVLATP